MQFEAPTPFPTPTPPFPIQNALYRKKIRLDTYIIIQKCINYSEKRFFNISSKFCHLVFQDNGKQALSPKQPHCASKLVYEAPTKYVCLISS